MSMFSNLRVVAKNGLEAPYDHGDLRSPYHVGWYDNQIARDVRQSGVRRVRWEYQGQTKEISDTFIGGIALDAKSDLLIVKSDKIRAYNPDGSVNHEIVLPTTVVYGGGGMPAGSHPVEGVAEIVERDGRILFGLEFQYDRIERRFYDSGTREWLERSEVYRN